MKELSIRWKLLLCYVAASENLIESEVQEAVVPLMMQTMQALPAKVMCVFENLSEIICDRVDF